MSNKETTGWMFGILFALLFGLICGLLIEKDAAYKEGQIDYAQGIRRYIVVDGRVLKFLNAIKEE